MDILGTDPICERVLACLRIADVQRLSCTNHRLGALVGRHEDSVLAWLKDLEVLRCLDCPEALLRRMSLAIRSRQYRVMSYEGGAHDPIPAEGGASLFDVFDRMWDTFGHDRNGPLRFATAHPLDLEELEVFREEAYDDIAEHQDEGGDNDEVQSRQRDSDNDNEFQSSPLPKKQKMLCASTGAPAPECSSKFCVHKHSASRLYHLAGNSSYCGACLDGSNYLKLMFCSVHVTGKNTDWSVKEIDYSEQVKYQPTAQKEYWGLQDNEFWVRVWYSAPYNVGELRFIGVGPRGRPKGIR